MINISIRSSLIKHIACDEENVGIRGVDQIREIIISIFPCSRARMNISDKTYRQIIINRIRGDLHLIPGCPQKVDIEIPRDKNAEGKCRDDDRVYILIRQLPDAVLFERCAAVLRHQQEGPARAGTDQEQDGLDRGRYVVTGADAGDLVPDVLVRDALERREYRHD